MAAHIKPEQMAELKRLMDRNPPIHEMYLDSQGRPHRDDGPAIIFRHGLPHHQHYSNGYAYYRHGVLHRDDGPARECNYGKDVLQDWYRHGKLHREDGPARIWSTGEQEWRRHGKLHREDGPAVENDGGKDGRHLWFLNGQEVPHTPEGLPVKPEAKALALPRSTRPGRSRRAGPQPS